MAADEGSSRKRHKSDDDAEKPTLKFRNYIPQVNPPLHDGAATRAREREMRDGARRASASSSLSR